MTNNQIIDNAKILCGDTSLEYLDKDLINGQFARAKQQVYLDIGGLREQPLCFTLDGNTVVEKELPFEMLKPALVLANGLAIDEYPYEQILAAQNIGLNKQETPELNRNFIIPTTAYYFRHSPEGRLFGISPIGCYNVELIYFTVPLQSEAEGAGSIDNLPEHYQELFVMKLAMLLCDVLPSMNTAKKLVAQDSNTIRIDDKEVANPATVAGTFDRIYKMWRMRKMDIQKEYDIMKFDLRKLLHPTVKPPPLFMQNWRTVDPRGLRALRR